MQLAARSYLVAGVALVGASAIAVAPAVKPPEVHISAINLVAAVDNPIEVFAPVAKAAETWLSTAIEETLSNPFPILQQLAANGIAAGQLFASDPIGQSQQAFTHAIAAAQAVGPHAAAAQQAFSDAGTALDAALEQLGAGFPALEQAVSDKLDAGDPNGAIDAVLSAGLNPILGLLSGGVLPVLNATGTLFGLPGPINDAVANAFLGVVLGAVASTVGIGFDLGDPQPVVKQFIIGIQKVSAAVKTGDPVTIVNAFQHSLADYGTDLIAQAGQMKQSVDVAVQGFVDALKQLTPKPASTVVATNALMAPAAKMVTLSTVVEPKALEAPKQPVAEKVAPVANASDAADSAAAADDATPAVASDDSTGSPSVTRDGIQAEPATAATGSGTSSARNPNATKSVRDSVRQSVSKATGGLKKSTDGAGKKSPPKHPKHGGK